MSELLPVPVVPKAGVVKTESRRVAEGRWIDCDKIEFVAGTDGVARPQKHAGWSVLTTTASLGNIRALHPWRDLNSIQYIAAGTYAKLYAYDTNYVQSDITPGEASGTLSGPFATSSGTPTVTVTDTAHGRAVNDIVTFSGSTAVGGITPNGTFTVATVINDDTYTFTFTSNASSTASGGGGASVAYSYEIAAGSNLASFGVGAGVGPYGLGTWGTARASSTLKVEPRVWSLDHFGQILLAAYNGGTLYDFDPTDNQPWPRAAIVTDAPDDIRFMFVTPERFVVALRDGLVMSWCTQGDYTTWTPSSTNTANTRTLTEGNRFMGGKVLGPKLSIIFTDGAAYRMQWTGNKFIHDTDLIGKNCGLVSSAAVVTVAGVAMWMGSSNFWMSSGSGVQPMPNVQDIREFVFGELTTLQFMQCHAYYNPAKHSVKFVYTVEGDTSPSKYVIFDIASQSWAPGTCDETAGNNFTQGDTRPIVAHTDGHIYQHEDGLNAAGEAMEATITLAPYALQEGTPNLEIEGLLLDLFEQAGDITVELETWDRLTDDDPMDTDTITQAEGDGILDARCSGRYLGFTLTSNKVDGDFRLGKPAAFIRATGRRR